jgi:hypothetical protein
MGYIEQPTVLRNDYAVSPFWALWVDTIYTGDPRFSEVATPSERSCIACYTDTQVRLFQDALLLPRAIDDHSVLLGKTGTIMKIGAKDWTDAWIISALSRGGLNCYLHGDLRLINDPVHEKFIFTVNQMLQRYLPQFANPKFIGGAPDVGEVYGSFLSSDETQESFIILHNPSFLTRYFEIPTPIWTKIQSKKITRLYPYEKVEPNQLIELAPAEVALLSIGIESKHFRFDETRKFLKGIELPIFDEEYIRESNSRIVGGQIEISKEILPQLSHGDLYFVINLTQSIYPWRIIHDSKRELPFSIQLNSLSLEFNTVPAFPAWAGQSWGVFVVEGKEILSKDQFLSSSTITKYLKFQIKHKWERLVRASIHAYFLYRGNRIDI